MRIVPAAMPVRAAPSLIARVGVMCAGAFDAPCGGPAAHRLLRPPSRPGSIAVRTALGSRSLPPMAAVVLVLTALFGLAVGARRLLNRSKRVGVATIVDPDEHTRVDPDGAVHSTQAADLTLPVQVVEEIWDPHHLE